VSSEAAARDLRIRARRRLIGALALVLAVVIVVPMLFDKPPPDAGESLIVVPAVVAPAADAPLRTPQARPADGGVIIAQDASGHDAPSPAPQTPQQTQQQNQAQSRPQAAAPTQAATPAPNAAQTTTSPARERARTDDGAVALALLEGRTPPAPPQAAAGGFVLQIAAYTTQQDAATQRDRLLRAGVSNAYVEAAPRNGQTAWRVRVGPFSSRDAAQAAQTRIRALGDYQDAFVTSQ